MMIDVKIRYNTLCNDGKLYWRILINGEEKIASDIKINIPTYTTNDDVFDSHRNEMVNKHHISCKANEVVWEGNVVIIN